MQADAAGERVGKPERAADAFELLHRDLEDVAEERVEIRLGGENAERLDQHLDWAARQLLGQAVLHDLLFERAVGLLQRAHALAQRCQLAAEQLLRLLRADPAFCRSLRRAHRPSPSRPLSDRCVRASTPGPQAFTAKDAKDAKENQHQLTGRGYAAIDRQASLAKDG